MKKILGFISAGLGYIFLWISATGFTGPFIYPSTFSNNLEQALSGGLLALIIGFIFRYLSLHKKPKKLRVLQVINNYFMLVALVSIPSITSMIGIIVLLIGITGYVVSDNILRKRSRLYEDSNIY